MNGLRKLFLLREDMTFLNHGSFGACPRPVFAEYQRWQRELEAQPVEFLIRRGDDLLAEARHTLGDFIGADGDDLVFVTNATTGLNIVIRSLYLEAGDEVLGTDHEYGALDRTWTFVCEKRGASYIRRPLPLPVTSADDLVEAIWSGVTDRTRVLFLSHITSPTAITMPVAELVRRGREAGLITIVDGAHAPGQIDLDLDRLGADYYAGNCHKWLLSPKGAAFLHARREMQHLLAPLVVSWGWRSETPGPSRFVDEHQWQGTRDLAAFLSVPAAIRFQHEHDWPTVRRRCHELVRVARQRILGEVGTEALTPDDEAWYGQMGAFPLPPCRDEVLKQRLWDEYKVEIPVTKLGDRRFLRIAVQGYNNAEDVSRLVTGLRAVWPEVC